MIIQQGEGSSLINEATFPQSYYPIQFNPISKDKLNFKENFINQILNVPKHFKENLESFIRNMAKRRK